METSVFLEQLGFAHHHSGFDYAEKAIDALIGGYDGKMMELYREVGKQTRAESKNVERSIRFAINAAMARNLDFFRVLGLPETCWGGKFANSEFLCTAAYRLKKMRENEDRKEKER